MSQLFIAFCNIVNWLWKGLLQLLTAYQKQRTIIFFDYEMSLDSETFHYNLLSTIATTANAKIPVYHKKKVSCFSYRKMSFKDWKFSNDNI